MRIAGKQVRYAMELLAGAFEESFRHELYVTFAKVQEKLGAINDHATAITMFNAWHERGDHNGSRAELAELIASERTQLRAECQEFRNWWTTERAGELVERFATLLQISSSPNADRAVVWEPLAEETHEMETVTTVGCGMSQYQVRNVSRKH